MASKIEKMIAEMRRAQDLVQESRAGEALGVYRELLAEARKMGLELAYLHYAMAVAQDDVGDLETAFEEITMAIGKDPLCLPFRHSFEVIVGRIRSALADALTRLHPTSREAWELAGAVAAALGDAAGAERARIEAAALAHRDAPFATVGVASA